RVQPRACGDPRADLGNHRPLESGRALQVPVRQAGGRLHHPRRRTRARAAAALPARDGRAQRRPPAQLRCAQPACRLPPRVRPGRCHGLPRRHQRDLGNFHRRHRVRLPQGRQREGRQRGRAADWTSARLRLVTGRRQMARALDAAAIRALIVEDNRDICANIAAYLEKFGYVLDFAHDGVTAMNLALANPFDVIVLDLMIPRMDGITFCQRLRADAQIETPVLMLTARDTLDDRLKGFDAGADDYLVKPFALQELHARLRALYKRCRRNGDNLLTVGDLTLNRSTLQVHRAGRRVEINPAGIKLLRRLMEESPSVVNRDDLETLLW